MAIFKRGKSWYIDYYADGRRIREAVGRSRKLAEKALAKKKALVAENRFMDVLRKPRTTFEQLSKAYMEYAKTNKRSWKRDDLSIRTLARQFGDKRLTEITPLAIEKYKTERRSEVEPATVNRELACLKHMFNKAIQWGLADKNPVKLVKLFRENNGRLKYLSKTDIRRLCKVCGSDLKPIVLTALYTGMRAGELLSLTWDDVDFRHGIIYVRHSKNGESRDIPMAPAVRATFKTLSRRSEYVFSRDDGRPVGRVRWKFANARREVGMEDFTFHDLRHTFASHLVMAGVDLLTVKELLGHRTINMTLRYAHLSPSHKRKAVESLEFFDGHNLDTEGVSA